MRLYERALALWRGPAFGDLHDAEWIRPYAVRLHEQHLTVLESYYEGRLGAGGDGSFIGELEGVVAANSMRERFVRQLMVALFREGRHADALRRASDFRRLVRHETGTDPTAMLTAIESQILANDPTLLGDRAALAASAAPRRSVPDGPTRLVGRTHDVARVGAAIRTAPLVTLLGPGGVGKTRLARHVAATTEGFAGGAAFVELAAVNRVDSLADAVATALDVQPQQQLTMEETLISVLAERHQLVVFDNCEHLLDSLVPFVDRIRVFCPRVHVLATSREPLGLPGEMVLPLAPLPVSASAEDDVLAIAGSPAVELLLERVSAAVPGFTITDSNARVIAEICRRLDGLPLALELVAAQFRSLSPEMIVQRVQQPATVLGTSMRSSDPRHRTLRDTVAWSYELLSPVEQAVYARLSAFAGTFDLNAVAALCTDISHRAASDGGAVRVDIVDIVGVIAALVDKSMVQIVSQQGSRYVLLETLREFGREKISELGALDQVSETHLRWFVDLAERSSIGITGPDEGTWSQQVEWDFDDLRLAFGRAVRSGDVDAAIRMTAALREFAFRRIRYELFSWANTVVAMPGAAEHPRFATVLAIVSYGHFVRGNLRVSIDAALESVAVGDAQGVDTSGLAERTLLNSFFYLGEPEEALRWGDRMVTSARTGSASRLAHALYMRSVAETSVGRTVQGAIMAGEASAVARVSGSPTALAQAAYALGLALEGSDPAESLRLLRQAARIAGAAGNRWIEAFADTEVWWLEARNGDVRTALNGSGVVIDTWSRGGDWTNLRLSLRRVFGLLTRIGDHRAAALLHGSLSASGALSALPSEPSTVLDASSAVHELRTALGNAAFEQAVTAGAQLSETELVHFVKHRISVFNQ